MALSSNIFCCPWLRMGLVLLAALALAGHFQMAEGVRIILVPPRPRTGQTVTLYVEDEWPPVECMWFRGNTTKRDQEILQVRFEDSDPFIKGDANTGRESAGWGCSLVIQGLELSDSGEYTVVFLDLRGNPNMLRGRLEVYE
ncbi:carcinoembryonic antigen-related cell adhesion molecule 16-like isoform X2 [Sceloporus undulatus]|uniref:carcinoembryonic antigen-related cell adhesion molecule 16-like isoform X2 n=1 Tax=Sceloporus undulatus TaxID=8520 RepID=UPI001C4D3369|nr:carcinoembryonic antigen-related cell adhesion molecule 16-like isoform X2 [Sceloporus undulatus]